MSAEFPDCPRCKGEWGKPNNRTAICKTRECRLENIGEGRWYKFALPKLGIVVMWAGSKCEIDANGTTIKLEEVLPFDVPEEKIATLVFYS